MTALARLSRVAEENLKNTTGAVFLSDRDWRTVFREESTLEPESEGNLILSPAPGDEVRVLAGVSMSLLATDAVGDAQRIAASRFLAELRSELARYDVRRFPAFRLARPLDGSLVIEWTLGDRRLGFSFEEDLDDSGWYYAFALKHGGRSASGSLREMNLEALLDLWFAVPLH